MIIPTYLYIYPSIYPWNSYLFFYYLSWLDNFILVISHEADGLLIKYVQPKCFVLAIK